MTQPICSFLLDIPHGKNFQAMTAQAKKFSRCCNGTLRDGTSTAFTVTQTKHLYCCSCFGWLNIQNHMFKCSQEASLHGHTLHQLTWGWNQYINVNCNLPLTNAATQHATKQRNLKIRLHDKCHQLLLETSWSGNKSINIGQHTCITKDSSSPKRCTSSNETLVTCCPHHTARNLFCSKSCPALMESRQSEPYILLESLVQTTFRNATSSRLALWNPSCSVKCSKNSD